MLAKVNVCQSCFVRHCLLKPSPVSQLHRLAQSTPSYACLMFRLVLHVQDSYWESIQCTSDLKFAHTRRILHTSYGHAFITFAFEPSSHFSSDTNARSLKGFVPSASASSSCITCAGCALQVCMWSAICSTAARCLSTTGCVCCVRCMRSQRAMSVRGRCCRLSYSVWSKLCDRNRTGDVRRRSIRSGRWVKGGAFVCVCVYVCEYVCEYVCVYVCV